MNFKAGTTILALLSILACAGGGTASAPPPPPPEPVVPVAPVAPVVAEAPSSSSALVAPWNTYGLPVADGEILDNDGESILIMYDTYSGGSKQLTADWQVALGTAGFLVSETVNTGDANITAVIYKKNTTLVGLAVGMEEGALFAYMEDLTGGQESVVRKGGKGAGKRRHARRNGGGREGKAGKRGDRNP